MAKRLKLESDCATCSCDRYWLVDKHRDFVRVQVLARLQRQWEGKIWLEIQRSLQADRLQRSEEPELDVTSTDGIRQVFSPVAHHGAVERFIRTFRECLGTCRLTMGPSFSSKQNYPACLPTSRTVFTMLRDSPHSGFSSAVNLIQFLVCQLTNVGLF